MSPTSASGAVSASSAPTGALSAPLDVITAAPSATRATRFSIVCERIVPATTAIDPTRRATTIARAASPSRPGKTAETITPIIVARATTGAGTAAPGSAARSTTSHDTARRRSDSAISAAARASHPRCTPTSAWTTLCSPRRPIATTANPSPTSAASTAGSDARRRRGEVITGSSRGSGIGKPGAVGPARPPPRRWLGGHPDAVVEVVALVEIVDEPGMRGPPPHELAGQRARGGDVGGEEVREPAEVLACVLGRDGDHREVEVATDHLGDLADRHAFVGDPVQNRSGRGRLQRQAEEPRGIEPVHGGPAVGPVADVAGDALLACDVDQGGDEAVISVVVNRRRQSHDRRADAAGGQSSATSARRGSDAPRRSWDRPRRVFRIAVERWVDETNERTLPDLVRDSLDELKAVTAGR